MVPDQTFGALQRFRQADGSIPCFRCGECCRRWQPLIDRDEVERLARYLGVTGDEVVERYTRPYPLDDRRWMVRTGPDGCVFHTYEDGLSACTVYEARPGVCREWAAGPEVRECREGLERMGAERALAVLQADLTPPGTNPLPEDGTEASTRPGPRD